MNEVFEVVVGVHDEVHVQEGLERILGRLRHRGRGGCRSGNGLLTLLVRPKRNGGLLSIDC